MGKNLFISNFKKIPIAFLATFFLYLLIQLVAVHSKDFWNICYLYSHPSEDDGIRLTAQLKTMPDTHDNKRIFLTGSSQTREDFDADYLNSKFKKEAIMFSNLGTSGAAQPIEMFMIKDSFLKKKPDVIVYMPFVGSFYDDYYFAKMKYYFNPKVLPYMLDYLGTKEIFANRYAFIDSFLSELFIFFKYRSSLRSIAIALLQSYLGVEARDEPRKFRYKENMSLAFFQKEIKKSKGNKYKNTPYTKLNKDLFVLFAKDIISAKIKFIVIDAPTHPLIKETYKSEIDTEYLSFLSGQAKKIGFVFLRKDKLPAFTEEDFIDFTHLNAQGREKITAFILKYFEQPELYQN